MIASCSAGGACCQTIAWRVQPVTRCRQGDRARGAFIKLLAAAAILAVSSGCILPRGQWC
eukprot:3393697-Alexandrium_andersonii.AAC.1